MTAHTAQLKTASGLVQYHNSTAEMLQHYNKDGALYELRTNGKSVELWHKGHNRFIGIIEEVTA